jgi:hypothetical protein
VADQASNGAVQLNRGTLVGAGVLIGLGGLLGLAGLLVFGSAAVTAARQWAKQLEPSPAERARRTWQKAAAASSAGTQAWRSGAPTA